MEELNNKNLWNDASKGGLVLGGISIAYVLSGMLFTQDFAARIGSLPFALMTIGLWTAKFAGCIWMMKICLECFANKYENITRRDVFREGVAIAFLSALIYSAFYYVYTSFINPEVFTESINQAMSTYSSMMDSNSLATMERMMDRLPLVSSVTNLIYCTLFGTVVSSICSRSLVSDDPFSNIE